MEWAVVKSRSASDADRGELSAPHDGGSQVDVVRDANALNIGLGDDILAVDDNPANLIAIEAALAPLGRTIVTAQSGLEALAKILEREFALILLDVAMPDMNGIETARMIRARERSRGTPIIFVTGMSWQDDAIDEAYEVGGYDFLIKPVRAEVLRAKARVYLQLQESTRALQRNAEELRTSQALLHEHELREQRKRLEAEALEAKVQQLAEVDRERHDFVAMIGHELSNPLQTLQLAFELVIQHSETGTTQRLSSLVERRFRHVNRIVDDLLDVALLATGQIELCRETVDLREITRQAVENCHAIIEACQHVVAFDVAGTAAPLVMGDPVRLLQALTSVVDNAARYTANGGRIEISVSVDVEDAVVRVTDTGRGIAPALLPRIFDMFVREHTGAGGSGGLGLGLALLKRLVDLHDGSVLASSDGPGTGSTFEIRLPLAPQDVELSTLELTEVAVG